MSEANEPIPVTQAGDSWHIWRKQGIGSSQVAAVLGISPYQTMLDVYNEKTSDSLPEEKSNFVMELGKRTEGIARAKFEIMMNGREFPPLLVVMEQFKFMRCSLDGWDKANNELLELKYVGKNKGCVPPHHTAQIQYQLLCSGAGVCHYQAYDYKEDRVILHPAIAVPRDRDYQKHIFNECCRFWQQVTSRCPPAATKLPPRRR